MKDGLTWANIRWAFSAPYFGFYYPLTLMSHMADRQIFGDWAGGFHAANVLFHLANTLLLMACFYRATKAPWRSFMVAALFALHPLHVESVAWIAERKDVLSTFFELLALLAYFRYVEKPSALRYMPVFFFFLAALLSKTMVVTFPALLLLLDYWPLARTDVGAPAMSKRWLANMGKLVAEKAPLLAPIPVAVWLTLGSQVGEKAMGSLEKLPLGQRFANALLSYGWYIAKMFAPARLAAYYPHPQGNYSVPLLLLSCLFLLTATSLALMYGKRYRYLIVGWFWYVGGLLPVIGIIQVGMQARADRYTYMPLVGLFVLAVWGAHDLLGGIPRVKPALVAAAVMAVLLSAALLARAQVATWRSNEALYGRIVALYPQCILAQLNLGCALGDQRRYDEAVRCFDAASRLTAHIPPEFKTNWGAYLSQLKRYDEAIPILRSAITEDPSLGLPYFELGFALSQLQRHAEAIPNYRRAFELKGASAETIIWIGDVYRKGGLCQEAVEVYQIIPKTDLEFARASEGMAACAGS